MLNNSNKNIEKLKKQYKIKINDNSLLKLFNLEKKHRDNKKYNVRKRDAISKVIIDDITIELRQKYKDETLIKYINQVIHLLNKVKDEDLIDSNYIEENEENIKNEIEILIKKHNIELSYEQLRSIISYESLLRVENLDGISPSTPFFYKSFLDEEIDKKIIEFYGIEFKDDNKKYLKRFNDILHLLNELKTSWIVKIKE